LPASPGWAITRDREPIEDASSIEAALNKWILPAIGDMPLAGAKAMKNRLSHTPW